MALQVRKLHNGSTTAVTLTLLDQNNNNISMTSGTLSCLLTPSSGTALLTSGLLTTSASGIGTITVSAGTLSNMSGLNNSGLVPFTLFCEARFHASTSAAYFEEFSIPIGTRDGEWTYGLTTLAYAREWLGLADNSDDAQLIKVIRGISQRIRKKCGRDSINGFRSASRTEEYDTPIAGELVLREPPITAITSVVVRHSGSSSNTISSDDYEITSDGKRIRFFGSFASRWDSGHTVGHRHMHGGLSHNVTRFPTQSVRIVYVGGDTIPPPDLEDITLDAISQVWSNIGQNRGLQSENLGNYAYVRRALAEVDGWLTKELYDGGWISARAVV